MKKTLFILVGLVALLLCSCKHSQEEALPADLIPRDSMVDIIADTWLLESSITEAQIDFSQLNEVVPALYDDFFKHHGITKDRFTHSIEYYLGDEKNAETFVRECQERLESKKDEFIGEKAPTSCPQ